MSINILNNVKKILHKQFFDNEHIKYTRKTDEYKSNAIDKYLENIGLICKYKEINSFDEAKKVLNRKRRELRRKKK